MNLGVKYSARFRDAAFYFSGDASTTGGRKTITREFPGSDRRYVEDMGLLNKTLTIEGIVTTEREKDKLINALETAGIGQLSHPTFGLLNVTAQPYTVVDSITTLGYCKFTMSFEVSQENIYPTVSSSNISFLQSKTSFLDKSIFANFASKIGISSSTLDTAINTATSVINTIDSATQSIEGVRNEILTVKETVVDSIQTGSAFLGEVKAIITSVTTFLDDPLASFDILKNMFKKSTIKSKPTIKKAIDQARVENTINQAVNAVIINAMYDSISQIDFENNIQLDSKRNTIESLYEDLIENPTDFLIEAPDQEFSETEEELPEDSTIANTSVLDALQEVRQLTNEILQEEENTVARVVEVNTYDTTLNDFVFSYYGNLDYINKIESMNDIQDRSQVSGTLRVLSK